MPDGCEVYAIRYARRDASAREHFYRGGEVDDRAMAMDYYIWVVRSGRNTVVLDTGFTAATAAERGRDYVASPVETLRALGIEPDEVDHLVLSHLHYDHTGHIDAFPNARIVVQEREVAFWTGPHAALGEYPLLASVGDIADLLAANQQGRVAWVDGDGEVVAGISVHLVGGHTPGSQVVRVETGGDPVVLAADASHFLANVEGERPYAIVTHLPDMYLAFRRLRELASPGATIIPGHDPEVMRRYAAPDPALEGVTVRIAPRSS